MTASRTDQGADSVLLGSLALPLLLYFAWWVGFGSGVLTSVTVVLLASVATMLAKEIHAGRWLLPAVLACLVVIAVGSPTDAWDARSIWLFHAKRMFFGQTLFAQLDGYAPWSHNDYPAMVPVLSASLAMLLGHWNELIPKLAGPLVMAPALVVVARQLPHPGVAAWLVLLLFCAGDWLVNGYIDAVLGVYFVAANVCALELTGLAEGVRARSAAGHLRTIVATGLLLCVLTLLKNEGVFAFGAIVVSVALLAARSGCQSERRVMACFALALAPILHWRWVTWSHGIDSYFTSPSLASHAIARMQDPGSLVLIAKSMLLNWPMPLSICLCALAAWRFRSGMFLNAAALAAGSYSAVIFAAYLATPHDLAWHLQSSVDRTMLPAALLLGYAAISSLSGARIGANGAWKPE